MPAIIPAIIHSNQCRTLSPDIIKTAVKKNRRQQDTPDNPMLDSPVSGHELPQSISATEVQFKKQYLSRKGGRGFGRRRTIMKADLGTKVGEWNDQGSR
jgi:hypothetical protein